MNKELFIFCGLMAILTFLYYWENKKTDKLSKRKEQATNMLKENILKQKLEKITEKKVKFSKRYKIETMCLQAGVKMSYSEYIMLGWISGLIVGAVVGTAMNNPILAIMFTFFGYLLPGQVISFIKNNRVTLLENQVGSFLKMFLKRYEVTNDAKKAIELTEVEFIGEQPMHSELKQATIELNIGVPIEEVIENLGRRTGNKFMVRLSDYYKVASYLGTEEVKTNLLNEAYVQFEENRQAKRYMKKELAGPVREAYIMLASIPMFALYQILTNDEYIKFMTTNSMGKIGASAIIGIFVGCIWFVNAKIGAPIE